MIRLAFSRAARRGPAGIRLAPSKTGSPKAKEQDMADDEKKDEASAPADEKAKRSKKLPLILAVVVLLAGGGGAAWYLGFLPGGGHREGEGEATAAITEEAGDHHDPNALGAMLALDPFIANLADPGGGRYLKTTFQLEFYGGSVPPDAQARMPQIRDLLLTLLTSKTFDDIRTPVGKQALRDDVMTRVNQVLDRDAVKAVYFTEFIVQ
jgi:flagellar protein FliL